VRYTMKKNSNSKLDKRIQREREGRRRKRNKKAGTWSSTYRRRGEHQQGTGQRNCGWRKRGRRSRTQT